jgi:hypothetical protein
MLVSIGGYTLCDGTREGGVSTTGMKFKVKRLIQVAPCFRAEQVETFDRGNRETMLSFDVFYTFDTIADAEAFVLLLEENLPSAGLVTLISSKPNGQTVVRYLADGKVDSHELIEQIGSTIHYHYELIGGVAQSTPPAE